MQNINTCTSAYQLDVYLKKSFEYFGEINYCKKVKLTGRLRKITYKEDLGVGKIQREHPVYNK